jgi:transposase InsO family protein
VNKDVEHICSESGIDLQHRVLYTPQQNGVIERKNGTLKEMTNYMLQAKEIPPKLWDEGINYASYIHNIVSHKSVKGVTPYEAWIRKKP